MRQTILLFIFICFSNYGFSQLNNNLNRGYGNGNNSMGQVNTPNTVSSTSNHKEDVVENSVQKLKEELDLNAFQEAVVKSYITENQNNIKSVIEDDIPDETKRDKINNLIDKLNVSISDILDDSQKVKFEKYIKKIKKRR